MAVWLGTAPVVAGPHDRTGTLWAPYVEWSFENSSYSGNPYDLVASATFTHAGSGQTITTQMFYTGTDTWKLRFTGTRLGQWTFTTGSPDADLDGKSGAVMINANSNPHAYGFVVPLGNKWARQIGNHGQTRAFVPQFVMYAEARYFHQQPDKIDGDIQTFMVEHGFDGFHTTGSCHWFDIDQRACGNVATPDPDPRVFEAYELLIAKVHAAGGVVHIWLWGDEERDWTIQGNWGGVNGAEDQRLQRYIAARLGPLPGWTIGYGFDLQEWVTEDGIGTWADYMHQHLGWPHMLGGRNRFHPSLDYSGYEQHRPTYDTYVWTFEDRPGRPSFSEDRFRIRNNVYPNKDYDQVMTRRGLYHSAMAGGVANIWGNLMEPSGNNVDSSGGSLPYPQPDWIKTYSLFFAERFLGDLVRDNDLTDGVCLRDESRTHHLFYKEDTFSIVLDLSAMAGSQPAVAVDTTRPYDEIDLGLLQPVLQTWTAPRTSDWAIAVGGLRQCGRPCVKPMLKRLPSRHHPRTRRR